MLPEDIEACFDRNSALLEYLDPPSVSYAGIDWGGGDFAYTVIWIMGKDDGRWKVFYVYKFDEKDPMRQVEIITNLIDSFNVKQAVADIGYGVVQVSELQKKFGSRVMGCQYVRRPEIPLEIRKRDDHGKRLAQMNILADRSFWIEKGIDNINHKNLSGAANPKLIIPFREPLEIEWIIEHFTCLELEEQESVKKYHHYTHPKGQPDDAFQAFIYALIAEGSERINPPLVVKNLFD